MKRIWWTAAAALALAACGTDGGGSGDAAANEAANAAASGDDAPAANAAAGNTAAAASGAPTLGACPFHSTSGWNGSIERGRLLVSGQVDLQMAGFKPTLAERPGGGGTLALDLTLAPEPQAAVTPYVRFERSGGPGYRRGEIWCGGERIADFDFILID